MAQPFDVIVAGEYCLDLIFTGLPKFPELGTEMVSTGFDMIPGAAYNSAVAMHRLGLKVGWAVDFGEDDFSHLVLRRARAEGLDESLFVRHKQSVRRITVALSYPRERAFIAYYDPEPSVAAAMGALATVTARALYVAGLRYGSRFDAALSLARARRMKLIMDGNAPDGAPDASRAAVKTTLRSVDVFMPNAAEARRMTGRGNLDQAIRALVELCPLVVVKDGAAGSYACSGEDIVHAPAIPITPLETTGAGDCFDAGFVKAWLAGLPLEKCLRWGNIVGGLSTLAPGGTGKVVTARDVEERL